MPDLKNTVLNDLLCYVSTARNALSQDNIAMNALAFYSPEAVKMAKETICKIAGEKNIVRKSCADHRNPISADLKDIYACFEKVENNNIEMPKFVAEGFSAFPPVGFENLAPILCALRDEVSALRVEVSQVREANINDQRALNSANIVAQDVTEIKAIVHRALSTVTAQTSSGEASVAQMENVHSNPARNIDTAPRNSQIHPVSNEPTNASQSDGFTQVNNRPYANALRRNGLSVNPARRQSLAQTNATEGRQAMQQMNGNRRRTVIRGTRTADLSIASNEERIFDVFVGGCGHNSTEDRIKTFCSESDVTPKKCEALRSASEWSKSYKLSVKLSDREKILDASFWPEGVFVRKFYRPRRREDS